MSTSKVDQRPGDAERLESFLGSWEVKGRLSSPQSQSAVVGKWHFDRAIDGWGVVGRLTTTIEGMGEFEEAEVIGLDAETGQVHMFSANRFAIRDHVGGWTDSHHLVVEYEDTGGATATKEVISVHFAEPGRMDARVVESADGEVVLTTDLTLVRKASSTDDA